MGQSYYVLDWIKSHTVWGEKVCVINSTDLWPNLTDFSALDNPNADSVASVIRWATATGCSDPDSPTSSCWRVSSGDQPQLATVCSPVWLVSSAPQSELRS